MMKYNVQCGVVEILLMLCSLTWSLAATVLCQVLMLILTVAKSAALNAKSICMCCVHFGWCMIRTVIRGRSIKLVVAIVQPTTQG